MKKSRQLPLDQSNQRNMAEQLVDAIDGWYETPRGAAWLQRERDVVNSALGEQVGDYVLQVEGPARHDFLQGLTTNKTQARLRYGVRVTQAQESLYQGPSVRAYADSLPFLANTLDAVILPHTIEFCDRLGLNVQQIVKESHRVLVGSGYIAIIGFNLWSVWGLYQWGFRQYQRFIQQIHKARHTSNKQSECVFPWQATFQQKAALKSVLVQIGFSIKTEIRFSLSSTGMPAIKSSWFERLNQCLSQDAGYLLVAQKTGLVPPSLRVAAERQRFKLGVGVLEPSRRHIHCK